MLLSASDDKTVKVWALPTQRFMFTLSGHMNWVRSAQFSPDCRLAVSGGDDKTMRVWDISTKSLLRLYDDHHSVINTVAFHPDGTCIASAGTDKVIRVWDIRCGLHCTAVTWCTACCLTEDFRCITRCTVAILNALAGVFVCARCHCGTM